MRRVDEDVVAAFDKDVADLDLGILSYGDLEVFFRLADDLDLIELDNIGLDLLLGLRSPPPPSTTAVDAVSSVDVLDPLLCAGDSVEHDVNSV